MRSTITPTFILTFALHASAVDFTAATEQGPSTTALATSTREPDSWQCVTKNLTKLFDVPRPTQVVYEAFGPYADNLLAPCRSTATGAARLSCTMSGSDWCGFATLAPDSVTAAYAAYATSAASWWSVNSAPAASLSAECPRTWAKFGFFDHYYLNLTIAHAECANAPAMTTTSATAATDAVSAVKSAVAPGRTLLEGGAKTLKTWKWW